MKKLYITDCEGPVSTNNNGHEVAQEFVPEGERLFALLAKFDEYLSDIEKARGHEPGSSLKYMLPFLKAAGVTDKGVREFSGKRVNVMKTVQDTLGSIRETMDVYLIGTSYVHHVDEVGRQIGLDPANVYGTQVAFDSYEMGEREQKMFTGLRNAFLQLPMISWSPEGLIPPHAQFSIDSLKAFLLERFPTLPANQWIKSVSLLAGKSKADTIINITKRAGQSLRDVVYVGDSATDVDALTLIMENGGLSISFNGNRHAILNAEYVVISRETDVLKDVAISFDEHGKGAIKQGTLREGVFVFSRANCNTENVICMSENMRREIGLEASDGEE